MTDRLEDILGGVEDEIRRAEERLQLGIFRVKRTPAAGESRETEATLEMEIHQHRERLQSSSPDGEGQRKSRAVKRREPAGSCPPVVEWMSLGYTLMGIITTRRQHPTRSERKKKCGRCWVAHQQVGVSAYRSVLVAGDVL